MVNEADIALPGSDDDYDEVTSTINDVTTDGSAAASMISAYFSLVDIRFLIQVTLTWKPSLIDAVDDEIYHLTTKVSHVWNSQ